MTKYKVTLRPELKTLEVNEGENLLQALRAQSVYVKSSCGGGASCSDCIIKVVSGEEHLSPIEFPELKLLGNVFHITKERLACQTKITGDITIDVSRHNKDLDQEQLKNKTNKMRPKKSTSTLRKKEVVEQIREEREQNFKEKEKKSQDQPWFKHWEKKDDGPTDRTGHQKKLGGGKRPKLFKYDSEED